MSFYTEARSLRARGETYEGIFHIIKEKGLKPLEGIITRAKVREACFTLHERIKSLRAQNMTLETIVERLSLEGYTTKRGSAPSIGCVWYALNRQKVLRAKSDARRL